MIYIILLIAMLGSSPAWGQDNLMKPGGPFNPYLIERDPGPGPPTYTIKPSFPDSTRKPTAPGNWANPYKLTPQPGGGYELRYTFPDTDGEEGGDE